MRQRQFQRCLRFDRTEQAARVEQVLAVEQEARVLRAQRQRVGSSASAIRSTACGSGLCTSAPPVPITVPTPVRSLPYWTVAGPVAV